MGQGVKRLNITADSQTLYHSVAVGLTVESLLAEEGEEEKGALLAIPCLGHDDTSILAFEAAVW
mgnify:CR=1 FL=1